MTKAEIQEYTLRITQGNRTDLIVTTYDIILKYIADASEELKKQDKKKYKWNIKKANEFIAQLMGALDLQYEVSLRLFQLYRFAQKRLIEASYEETDKKLEDVIPIFRELREAFSEVAKQDNSGPVMRNIDQVYAGLTYGKGSLNEIVERKKGFQA